MIASQLKYDQRSNVSERGYSIRFFQNTDDLHFSPSCSMVVTLHDHITSPVVFCNAYMYIFLIISDVRAPHRHGKIMVMTWLYLSIENILSCEPCTITNYDAVTSSLLI